MNPGSIGEIAVQLSSEGSAVVSGSQGPSARLWPKAGHPACLRDEITMTVYFNEDLANTSGCLIYAFSTPGTQGTVSSALS